MGQRGSPCLHIDRLLSENPLPHWTSFRRAYRADAAVFLLWRAGFLEAGRRQRVRGPPRSVAGRPEGHFAAIRRQVEAGPRAGVNDCGSIEEVVIERSSVPVEAAYFAFITGAADDAVDDARRRVTTRLPPSAASSTAYTAVDGVHHAGEARNKRASVVVADRDGTDCDELIREVRTGFYSGRDLLERQLCLGPAASGTVPATVLYAVAAAVRARTNRFHCLFVYNARQYHLYTEKSRDERAAGLFFAKGLTTSPQSVVRILGQVCDQHRSVSSFKLWMEEGAAPALPLRIEFQPRPYLRVSLEFDPALESRSQQDDGNQHNEET